MSDAQRSYNVLFLCTGNSARSILAECILNREGQGRFNAYSAGSQPAGKVNPNALSLLKRLNYPTAGLRSKPWDEFAAPSPVVLDFVFTVCDNAAGEVCPIWPGHPATAHWGIDDPAHVEPLAARREAFEVAYRHLERRIRAFLALPLETLSAVEVKVAARRIHVEAGQ